MNPSSFLCRAEKRYREGQALAFACAPHHIAFKRGKGRTMLVFSLLLCNDKQVFQRLVSRGSVTEGGWLLSSNSRCSPREYMIFA